MWFGIRTYSEAQPEGCGYLENNSPEGATTGQSVAAGFSLRMCLGLRTYSETQPEGCGYLNLFQYQYLVRP